MKAMKLIVCGISALAASVSLATDWSDGGTGTDYVFGSSDAPLATSSVIVPENQVLQSLIAYPDADSIFTLTGGPLIFSGVGILGNAYLGTVEVDAPIIATQGLTIGIGDRTSMTVIEGTNLYPVADKPKVMFTGINLDDYEITDGWLKGFTAINNAAYPAHVYRTNGIYDVQMQIDTSGDPSWQKCVKIRLWQEGNNVMGQGLYARWAAHANGAIFGWDFDRSWAGEGTIAKDAESEAYGVRSLRLARIDQTWLDVKLKQSIVGNLSVDSGSRLNIELSNASTFTNNVALNGTMTFCACETVVISNHITGSHGNLNFKFPDTQITNTIVLDKTASLERVITTTDTLIAPNQLLENLIDFSNGHFSNGSTAVPYFPRWKDGTLEVQFQGWVKQSGTTSYPGYVCCNVIRFRQTKEGVFAKLIKQPYQWGYEDQVGQIDFENAGGGGNYKLTVLTLRFLSVANITLASNAETTYATTQIGSNLFVNAVAQKSIPMGTVKVNGGGALYLYSKALVSGSQIQIDAGGVAQQMQRGALDSKMSITLNGGTMHMADTAYGDGRDARDSGDYLNRMTFKDGAVFDGMMPRIGTADAYYSATGSKPSYWNCGGYLVGSGNAYTLYVSVDDVTGDEASDLISSAYLTEFSESHVCKIKKNGSGTWEMASPNKTLTGTFTLSEGTLLLSCSAAGLHASGSYTGAGMTFKGGTLALGESVSNHLYAITLEADSKIALAPGATLTVGDSSAKTWNADATLEIVGELGPHSLRFGTSKTGLTARQCLHLRYGGRFVRLNEQGYARAVGSTILIR